MLQRGFVASVDDRILPAIIAAEGGVCPHHLAIAREPQRRRAFNCSSVRAVGQQARFQRCTYGAASTGQRLQTVRCRFFKKLFGPPAAVEATDVEFVDAADLPFPVELLDDTFLRGRRLALAYRGTRDGWDALTFHKLCDFKGPCVIVGTTDKGAKFGGFQPEGFKGSDDYASSHKAFLFCWPVNGGQLVTLEKVGGPEAAVFDFARGGPQWGADGLVIGPPLAPVMGGMAGPSSETLGAGDLRNAKSRLGLSYASLPPGLGQTSLFGCNEKRATATLSELEVIYAPEIAALY